MFFSRKNGIKLSFEKNISSAVHSTLVMNIARILENFRDIEKAIDMIIPHETRIVPRMNPNFAVLKKLFLK